LRELVQDESVVCGNTTQQSDKTLIAVNTANAVRDHTKGSFYKLVKTSETENTNQQHRMELMGVTPVRIAARGRLTKALRKAKVSKSTK